MNEDHADVIVLYAQAFGGLADATAAEMLAIDAQGINLKAQVNQEAVPVRIQFDHILVNAEDAHHTLIDKLQRKRKLKLSDSKSDRVFVGVEECDSIS